MTIYYILSIALGLIIGSFLNVVILRFNTGRSINGRSGCFSCGKTLHWYELIPVLSFLIQGGRCRGCRSKISWQYPLVELLTATLFTLAFYKFYPNILAVIFACIILAILIVLTVYDLKHKIIPDSLVYSFIALAIFWFIRQSFVEQNFGGALGNLLAGLVLFVFFWALWYFSGGRAMGFGDAKLAFGIGALLGFRGGVSAVILAFWLGAAIGLGLIWLKRRHYNLKSELPFAPFLFAGLILAWLFGVNLINF